jgi:hypothetical protein
MNMTLTCLSAAGILLAAVGCGARSDLWGLPDTFAGSDADTDPGTDTVSDMDVPHEPETDVPPATSTWIVRLGGTEADMALSVVEAAGGIFIAGQTYSFVQTTDPLMYDIDEWIIKLDLDGSVLLQESLGGMGQDEAYAVIAGRDGNVIVAGSTASHGAGWTDMWVLELDSQGRVAAQGTVGTRDDWDHAYALTETSDGGLAMAGSFMGGEGVVKLGADGRVAWYAAMSFVDIYAVTETADGGLAMAGNWAGLDIWIGKLDAAGRLLWQKQIGGVRYDAAWGIIEAADGTLLVSGNTEPFTTTSETWPLDMWIGRLAADGTVLWQRTVGGDGGESGNSIIEDADGGFIVAGTASTAEGENYDMAVLEIDADGAVVWQKMIGGSGYEEGRSVAVTHDGGYVVVGSVSDDASGSPDVLAAKLGPDGSFHGPCSLVRDSAFSSDESRLPVSDGTTEPRIEGEVFQQESAESARPSDASPDRLCPEP